VLVEGGEVASANAPLPELLAWSREGRDERCSGEDGEACSTCSSRNAPSTVRRCCSVYAMMFCILTSHSNCEYRVVSWPVLTLHCLSCWRGPGRDVTSAAQRMMVKPAAQQQHNTPSTVSRCCSVC
jgi:hypothetical protein